METWKMRHPKHGVCIADEVAEPQLLELGWTRESAPAAPSGAGEGTPGAKGGKKEKTKGDQSPAAPSGAGDDLGDLGDFT